MANSARGSVALQVGDKAYTLSYSVNAICELEDHFEGKPVAQIAETMNDQASVPMSTVRAVIWAGLIDHHPELTLKDAGNVASEAGIPACMNAVGRAFALAFPDAPKGAKPRPRKAVNG